MDEFARFIAENWKNEQEYDGRMETWCFYCGKHQEPHGPESHNEGCLHIKALSILNAAEQAKNENELEDCPFCPNRGWYPDYDRNGKVVQVQCEFCWTNPLSKFNASNTTPTEQEPAQSS
jgi:hypothetical protein